jgi:hemolysin activation/secretion protein
MKKSSLSASITLILITSSLFSDFKFAVAHTLIAQAPVDFGQLPNDFIPRFTPLSPSIPDPNLDRFRSLEDKPLPVDIVDSERSRNACKNTIIPFSIQSVRFVFEYEDDRTGIYTDTDLLALATPLIQKIERGEPITVANLCEFTHAITRQYVEDGYYTSRSFLPEQELTPSGIITIRILEGLLSPEDIQINGLKRLPKDYIRDQISRGIGENHIFRYQDIDAQLRLLQTDPLIQSITASVGYDDTSKPRPARTRLIVNITEKDSIAGGLSFDNYAGESIGSEQFTANLTYRNLSGIGDTLTGSWTRTLEGGVSIYRASYRAPLNAKGGALRLETTIDRSKIIQPPFDQFNIQGESEEYGLSVRQPLIRNPQQELALSLGYRFQRNKTLLQNQGIAFNRGPDENGTTRLSTVQFGQDFFHRNPNRIWALQSQLNWGIGGVDATINDNNDPDSQFLSWLLKAQRIQQINQFNTLLNRLDVQLSNDGLFNTEQLLIGGAQSVRGYRQNLRSGDNGIYFSTENRIQAYRGEAGQALIQFAPFFDLGYVWNDPKNTNAAANNRFLASLGVGILWTPYQDLDIRMDYGYPLTQLSESDRGEDALQSQGVHFTINYNFD